ncbi:lymphocyte function-associated antigen 3 isoform X2 [Gracilinanus agilis]|uniref:lymphocyte function-associated antigen 3 isoform X2 n=1 Tax=Gracilinanus agilis TaxID=191870 RepID=UPI001CFEEF92|nr:lymphocyte function-associated antigen 3 isoform X2 [Gracilinanus agilis]XP_044528368.1 lymphocyte function-associated antigen 3 isoform X2 [Gracilinanus agilis]
MAAELCWIKIRLRFALALFILSDSGMCGLVKNIFGLVNENVTLSPSHKTDFEDITWKKRKDKVAEWPSKGDQPSYYASFYGRATLDPKSGNFTIHQLMASDEGQYEIESSSLPESESMTLYVVDKLLQPALTCTSDEENITVSCNGSENSNFLNYTWKSPVSYVHLSEKKVQLSRMADLDHNIQCIISNPRSNNESALFLRTCVLETNGARNRSGIIGAVFIPIISVLYITGVFGHVCIPYP